MGDKAWKQFERDSGALFSGRRYGANTGERVDFAGKLGTLEVSGQCKLMKSLSLNELTKLAEEMEAQPDCLGVVCVKVRRGTGVESQPLVVLTFNEFTKLKSLIPARTADTRNWAGS